MSYQHIDELTGYRLLTVELPVDATIETVRRTDYAKSQIAFVTRLTPS